MILLSLPFFLIVYIALGKKVKKNVISPKTSVEIYPDCIHACKHSFFYSTNIYDLPIDT